MRLPRRRQRRPPIIRRVTRRMGRARPQFKNSVISIFVKAATPPFVPSAKRREFARTTQEILEQPAHFTPFPQSGCVPKRSENSRALMKPRQFSDFALVPRCERTRSTRPGGRYGGAVSSAGERRSDAPGAATLPKPSAARPCRGVTTSRSSKAWGSSGAAILRSTHRSCRLVRHRQRRIAR